MLRQYEIFKSQFLQMTDTLFQPLGFYVAILIAIGFMVSSVLIMARLSAPYFGGSYLQKILIIVLAFPVWVVATIACWRLFMFTARHIAQSPLPYSMIF